MHSELKPCPFCGGNNIKHRPNEYFYMRYFYCDDCGAIGPDACDTGDEAYQWNQRAERTCKYKHIEGTWYSCDICGYWHDGILPPSYCPQCGAKVVE